MLRVLGLVCASLLVLSACGGNAEDTDEETGAMDGRTATEQSPTPGDEATGPATVMVNGAEANMHGRMDVSGKASIEFELDSFYFEPTILVGEPGQEVTLQAHNESDTAHTFTLDEQGVDEVFQAGQERDITVSFPDSGSLVFICRFHERQGMRGALRASG